MGSVAEDDDVVLECGRRAIPYIRASQGTIPEGGHLVDMQNWVFRHEPSAEPTRMQAFRVREFVRVGSPGDRDRLAEHVASARVGASPVPRTAGRVQCGVRPLLRSWRADAALPTRQQKLKFEVLIPVISETAPTAVCSFNYHQDRFWQNLRYQDVVR